ncbi:MULTISPECIES: MerR family transcriptional regulator [Streptomyces]|uniref:MerR family transcriptional regulator n=2 Tax=Streptomyces TaxID=1883 RepID=A0A117IX85_9ACTN|nr:MULTISPECIES: MerR family transcriptional regulator [Streptomyces]KUH40235.1 MerR family transcriptional regulator [Streptomyces kanasensis]UUS34223.1 MerR family DNA-binding transcriptional regulator [Streptomyces changanensis]
MSVEETWSIGELAERAGVTVKTVRYYSDLGLLPEDGRSAGGHRRYGPGALDRLRLIRSLRGLDVPVADVGRVLEREGALDDVIAGHLRDVGSRMVALRWREAALRLLQESPAEERAERLCLVGSLGTPPSTAPVARFLRRVLPPRLPARLFSAISDAAVPQPPAEPTPAQVLALARLNALAADGTGAVTVCRTVPGDPGGACRPAVLYEALAEVYAAAAPELRAARQPSGGAVDAFVAAHAGARGLRDTPAFRRRLTVYLDELAHPGVDRFWRLTAELAASPEPTFGATDDWLRAALAAEVTAAG